MERKYEISAASTMEGKYDIPDATMDWKYENEIPDATMDRKYESPAKMPGAASTSPPEEIGYFSKYEWHHILQITEILSNENRWLTASQIHKSLKRTTQSPHIYISEIGVTNILKNLEKDGLVKSKGFLWMRRPTPEEEWRYGFGLGLLFTVAFVWFLEFGMMYSWVGQAIIFGVGLTLLFWAGIYEVIEKFIASQAEVKHRIGNSFRHFVARLSSSIFFIV